MERLTSREDVELIKRTNPQLIGSIAKEYIRLAEFEDFMEEYPIDDLIDLKNYIEDLRCLNKGHNEEILRYKNMWEKLKDWILDTKPAIRGANTIFIKSALIDKIFELEKENKCK